MERFNTPLTNEAAKKLLSLDLDDKVITSVEKLDEWYTAWGGQCYVSFSGGKDSTVLAYLAARYLSSFRAPPWELNLVFVNTGLEYPEIQKFVNEYADWLRREFPRVTVNLHRLRPKMNIRQVVTKYGYSIVSKEVAGYVSEARRNPNGLRMKRLRGEAVRKDGQPSVYNCEKWELPHLHSHTGITTAEIQLPSKNDLRDGAMIKPCLQVANLMITGKRGTYDGIHASKPGQVRASGRRFGFYHRAGQHLRGQLADDLPGRVRRQAYQRTAQVCGRTNRGGRR